MSNVYTVEILSTGRTNLNKITEIDRRIKSDLLRGMTSEKTDKEVIFGFPYGSYILKTYDFLQKIFFKKNTIKINEILLFVKIARNFLNINLIQNQETSCDICNSTDISNEEYETICNICGKVLECKMVTGVREQENNISKSMYSSVGNLSYAIDKISGKNGYVPDITLDIVRDEISKRKIDISKLNIDEIFVILKDLNLGNYYNDFNYIYCKLKEKEMPADLDNYKEKLYSMYVKYERGYTKIKSKKNSQNIFFILFKLLEKIKYDTSEFNYCILKTESKMDEHNEKFKDVCKMIGLN
jgi:hypothetical protein